jgi:SAM-dependent methyltransferase
MDHKHIGEWNYGFLELLHSMFDLGNKRCLDIGCAAGTTTKIMNDFVNNVSYGCDINPRIIEASPFKEIKDKLFCIESTELSKHFDVDSFDLVQSHVTFEHFPNWKYSIKVAKEINKVLKSNGIFFCILDCGEHQTVEQLVERQKKDRNLDVTHVNMWPRQRWIDLFTKLGLTNISDIVCPMVGCFISTKARFAYYHEYQSGWGMFCFIKGDYNIALSEIYPRFSGLLQRQKDFKNIKEIYKVCLDQLPCNPIMKTEIAKWL